MSYQFQNCFKIIRVKPASSMTGLYCVQDFYFYFITACFK